MRFFIPILFALVSGCAKTPSNELEQIGEDVLKDKEGRGLEIDIKPIPKAKPSKAPFRTHYYPPRTVCKEQEAAGIEIIHLTFDR